MPNHYAPNFVGEIRKWPGVYLIADTASGECYIGRSFNVRRRLHDHHAALCRGNHPSSTAMQEAFNRDGPDAFTYSVLFYAEPEDLRHGRVRLESFLEAIEDLFMQDYTCDFNTHKPWNFGAARVREDTQYVPVEPAP